MFVLGANGERAAPSRASAASGAATASGGILCRYGGLQLHAPFASIKGGAYSEAWSSELTPFDASGFSSTRGVLSGKAIAIPSVCAARLPRIMDPLAYFGALTPSARNARASWRYDEIRHSTASAQRRAPPPERSCVPLAELLEHARLARSPGGHPTIARWARLDRSVWGCIAIIGLLQNVNVTVGERVNGLCQPSASADGGDGAAADESAGAADAPARVETIAGVALETTFGIKTFILLCPGAPASMRIAALLSTTLELPLNAPADECSAPLVELLRRGMRQASKRVFNVQLAMLREARAQVGAGDAAEGSGALIYRLSRPPAAAGASGSSVHLLNYALEFALSGAYLIMPSASTALRSQHLLRFFEICRLPSDPLLALPAAARTPHASLRAVAPAAPVASLDRQGHLAAGPSAAMTQLPRVAWDIGVAIVACSAARALGVPELATTLGGFLHFINAMKPLHLVDGDGLDFFRAPAVAAMAHLYSRAGGGSARRSLVALSVDDALPEAAIVAPPHLISRKALAQMDADAALARELLRAARASGASSESARTISLRDVQRITRYGDDSYSPYTALLGANGAPVSPILTLHCNFDYGSVSGAGEARAPPALVAAEIHAAAHARSRGRPAPGVVLDALVPARFRLAASFVYKNGDTFGMTCGGVSGEDAAGDLMQYVRSFQLGGSGSSAGAGPIVDGAPYSFASVAWFAVVRKVATVAAGAGGGASALRVKERRIVKTLRPLESAMTAEELHEFTLFCFIAALQLYAQVYESAATARSAILDYLPAVLRREDVRAYIARHPASAHPLDISDTASLIRCLQYTFDVYGRPLRLVGAVSLYIAGLKGRGESHALVCVF